jgi:hypothetical protein
VSPALLSDTGLIEGFPTGKAPSLGTRAYGVRTGFPRLKPRVEPLPGNPDVGVGLGTLVGEPGRERLSGDPWRIADAPGSTSRFRLLQQWEGTVLEATDSDFVAIVTDLTESHRPEEEVTMSLEEVPEADLPLVRPGAVFYWSIGYRTVASGQTERVSSIRFRRLPAWSRSEIESARREAKAILRELEQRAVGSQE